MKHINSENLKNDGYDGLEFKENLESNWFISYSRLDNKVYEGQSPFNYDLSIFEGNLIILTHDDYVDQMDLILIENPKTFNVTVFWKLTNNYEKDWLNNLICELNSDLEITKSGKDPEGELLSFKNNKFDNLQSLIIYIDQEFFYRNFETY